MRVLITGSRDWSDDYAIYQALRMVQGGAALDGIAPEQITVVHGDARGADKLAARAAKRLGMVPEAHPADWSLGRRAGPERNKHMVSLGADICLGFPEADSRGTLGCMRLARNAGIPVKNLGANHEEFPAEAFWAGLPAT